MGLTYHPPHIARLEEEVPGAPEAEMVVAPKTSQDVAAVLRHATDNKLNVQVLGGGTRSGFGSPPAPDIVMSMLHLDEIEAWEPEDLTLVVGAGARVSDVESRLGGANQTAVLPEVPGESTVGGAIASGASALRRGRLYGTRERLLETTVVTGDGRIVRAGGRVVKNVTGYDLARLSVGAFGSLGVIVSVCLKLWPVSPVGATVHVEDINQTGAVSRPLAVLESREGISVFVSGTAAEVSAMTGRFEGEIEDGLIWPADPIASFRWSLRVPPAATKGAIAHIPDAWQFLAIHGVGEVRAASSDLAGASELREWAESKDGYLVVTAYPPDGLDGFDPWGRPPAGLEVQRRLIAEFDPARIINPGRLPGGL